MTLMRKTCYRITEQDINGPFDKHWPETLLKPLDVLLVQCSAQRGGTHTGKLYS